MGTGAGLFNLWPIEWKNSGYWILVVLTCLMVFAIVRNIFVLVTVYSNINQHWVLRKLARFGDPMLLTAAIEQETKRPRVIGSLSLTPSWMLRRYMFGVEAIPMEAVVWIYKRVTKKSVNFIPSGTDYAAIIWIRTGESLEFGHDVDSVLQEVASRAPWAIAGYSKSREDNWHKSRRVILDEVDDRRRTLGGAVILRKPAERSF